MCAEKFLLVLMGGQWGAKQSVARAQKGFEIFAWGYNKQSVARARTGEREP